MAIKRKLRSYKDYKGLTPRQAGIKYEKAGKSVADDKKIANWLAANKPKGTGEGLKPIVNSRGQIALGRTNADGRVIAEGHGANGRKESTQNFLKETGRTSRRNAQRPTVNRQAKKLRSEGFERNVRKYEYELTPKYDKKAVSKLVGRAARVQEANTTHFKDTDWRNSRTKTESYAKGSRSKLAPRITTKRTDGGGELTASPARAIRSDYRGGRYANGVIRPYVDSRNRARRVEDLKITQPTGLVRSKAQADRQIEKTYGKKGTYYDSKVVGEKGLSIRKDRKASEGRYVWTDITAKENPDRGYRTERRLTADDRKKYMKKKIAERKARR